MCQETSPSHGFNNFLDSVPVPAERFSLFSVRWSLLNLPKHIEIRTASPHESSHGSPFLQSRLHDPESGKVGPLLSGHRPSEVVFKSLPAPYCFPVLNLRYCARWPGLSFSCFIAWETPLAAHGLNHMPRPPAKSSPTYPFVRIHCSSALSWFEAWIFIEATDFTHSLVSLLSQVWGTQGSSPWRDHEVCGSGVCASFVVTTFATSTVAAYSRCQLIAVE